MPFGDHHRGYLPHVDRPHLCQSLTFRLADAVPASAIAKWKRKLEDEKENEREKRLRALIDTYEDAGHGSCVLGNGRIAAMVAGEITADADVTYRLYAWAVMPNHVHVLLGPLPDEQRIDISSITKKWKGRSARFINEALDRRGALWQRESYDRWIRDPEHFQRVGWYIENNPVKAGLHGWEWVSRNFIATAG